MDYLTPVHAEILEVLNRSGVVIIVNNHSICKSKKYDGYTITSKDPINKSGETELILCENVVKQNYSDWKGEMNRTLAHESVHAAQQCKRGDGYLSPLGFGKDIESEAFKIQDKPKEVLRILKKYCL